jgi:hypothetical protein
MVVEEESAGPGISRLLLSLARDGGPAGTVRWEFCYGGLPIATGELSQNTGTLAVQAPSVQPFMDSAGFTITARDENGRPAAIEATCVRLARPPTRAEAVARAAWPGVRDQDGAPAPRRHLVAETCDAHRFLSAGPEGESRHRSVCVYYHFSALLARRRRSLRKPQPQRTGRGQAG